MYSALKNRIALTALALAACLLASASCSSNAALDGDVELGTAVMETRDADGTTNHQVLAAQG